MKKKWKLDRVNRWNFKLNFLSLSSCIVWRKGSFGVFRHGERVRKMSKKHEEVGKRKLSPSERKKTQKKFHNPFVSLEKCYHVQRNVFLVKVTQQQPKEEIWNDFHPLARWRTNSKGFQLSLPFSSLCSSHVFHANFHSVVSAHWWIGIVVRSSLALRLFNFLRLFSRKQHTEKREKNRNFYCACFSDIPWSSFFFICEPREWQTS